MNCESLYIIHMEEQKDGRFLIRYKANNKTYEQANVAFCCQWGDKYSDKSTSFYQITFEVVNLESNAVKEL